MKLINPHGGTLVNCEVTGRERERLIEESAEMSRIELSARAISDLELIAIGAFSPLDGFLNYSNYQTVVRSMCLASGAPWTIPITLAVSAAEAKRLREGTDVALYEGDHLLAVLHLAEKFTYDKKREAELVYPPPMKLIPV